MNNLENNVVANYTLKSTKLQTSHNSRKLRATGLQKEADLLKKTKKS